MTKKLKKPKNSIWISLFLVIVVTTVLLTLGKHLEFKPKPIPEGNVISLKQPSVYKGKTLIEALKNRKSGRDYADRKISKEDLSGLLWAANGLNRPAEGKHTAPTARNVQNIDIYVFTDEAIYRYNAKTDKLIREKTGDFRSVAGKQEFAQKAPLNIVLVANYGKMQNADGTHEREMSFIGVGYISQNIYLYAAAFDMETVARAMIDKAELKKVLGLSNDQEALLAHSIGYPKDKDANLAR